ncbi:flagellar filament capping protein FliD [Luxibacter massiliensis]|uniref:flagellar filament capping protein FliD n=1 Tax=Luxibacter massiliensis TaxID=2219695 RepID=UPI000F07026E|nr:flagellar filament capping protein FliD [Luxibacter massiliensis]
MSGIGGLSSSTSSSIRGYGGLASGLDRDTLIENMTYGTTSKIEKQQQKKTTLQWKQSAIQNITDKMINFADTYTSTMTSTTNLFSSAFWGRNIITALGANSKFVSVSGTASSANSVSIAGIKQLAEKARWTSQSAVSSKSLTTGDINPDELQNSDTLSGKTLTFKYGGNSYTVTLSGQNSNNEAYKFDTVENIKDSLNDILSKEELKDGRKLSEVIDVATDGDKIVFKDKENTGNELKLTGGSALELLGFKDSADSDFTEISFSNGSVSSKQDIDANTLTESVSFVDKIAGKEMTVSYNGTSKTIKMPEADELAGLTGEALMDKIAESLQGQMDDAFGKGRISVKNNDNSDGTFSLEFVTTKPGDGSLDESSTLTFVNGSTGLLGENGLLKTAYGANNRLNLNAKLEDAGFAGNLNISDDPDNPTIITINGTDIEITKDDTVYTLMDKINKNTDVTVSYQAEGDKFTFTSNEDGASGSIEFGGDTNALEAIFGQGASTVSVQGQDAIVSVKYGDTGDVVEIIRGSNSFNLDGMTIGLKGTFGYDDTGKLDSTAEEITFDANVDTDKIVDAVKEMVEAYNEIVELVNKEVQTKPDRDYAPLTSDQKSELSEDEIKLYEEKAKEGLLFNDSDLRALSNDLRFAISPADLAEMEKLGLSISSTYSDNGKLVLDETKFRAALESDPEKVEEMFTKTKTTDASGNTVSADGIATNLKNVMYKYANNIGTYGILVNKAGTSKAPRSITDNTIYKELEEINKKISDLQDRLETERDRYIQQFTSLETLISQMNSQSSYLSQFGASY